MKPRVLVIAGSDSSAGAGVDADREALSACGVEVLEVVTAWTRQDEGGLHELGAVAPARWSSQARAAAAEAGESLAAVRIGLLPGLEAVCAAARLVDQLRRERGAQLPVVLDPVLAASSGRRFLSRAAAAALRERLLPLELVWTPNLPEAAELTGRELGALQARRDEREAAARELIGGGARAVVLKGGHAREDPALDLLLEGGGPVWLAHSRLPGPGIRGSGCRFASALAGSLACGATLEEAARSAAEFVLERIRRASAAGPPG